MIRLRAIAAAAVLLAGLHPLDRPRVPVAPALADRSLRDPVEIWRDSLGVPHLWAGSETDLAFALGYVHAEDRIAQMDLSRRLAAGRLAEILGPDAFRPTGSSGRSASRWRPRGRPRRSTPKRARSWNPTRPA